MGIPAQGRALEANGVYIFRMVDGKIAEIWNVWDTMNVLRQLGALPVPGHTPS